ncbi:aldehyde dehydrogenase family protein [Paraburkholderia sp. RL17-347-BIC-D]|uniref:aldehyde dehydrogenase family protein n=1 Tax=Paraburkholderia sp. RL17-347-BIC-D TaxID=3031632 RepID=UPI0038BC4D18
MIERKHFYIDGRWVAPSSIDTTEVTDSSTAELYATIPAGGAADVDAAVDAARSAFADWSQMPPERRAEFLQKIADGLKARTDELARAIATEVGMPLRFSTMVQVGGPIASWSHYAKLAREFPYQEQVGNSVVVREPVGVVAAITPWNYPLNQITMKVAPALAAGCTVVLKPSEVAPINAFMLADVIHEAGLPPGVFNLVTGFGPVVGEALARHPDVDMVSFTGSTAAGKRISEVGSQSVKRISLELGGKSASLVLEDADFERAVKSSVSSCYLNSGQTCAAWTRLLVPRTRLEEAGRMAKLVAESYAVGGAFNDGVKLGPLVSAAQRDRVLGCIKRGIDDGAELITGGLEPPVGVGNGYFVKPTVFIVNDPKAAVAQEEIFGPVLTIIPYDSEVDAVRIANDSIYGLAGAVWAGTDERAMQVARQLRTGQVDVNGGRWNPLAPFGGYKQSGRGRENGIYGMEEFLEYKAMQFPT